MFRPAGSLEHHHIARHQLISQGLLELAKRLEMRRHPAAVGKAFVENPNVSADGEKACDCRGLGLLRQTLHDLRSVPANTIDMAQHCDAPSLPFGDLLFELCQRGLDARHTGTDRLVTERYKSTLPWNVHYLAASAAGLKRRHRLQCGPQIDACIVRCRRRHDAVDRHVTARQPELIAVGLALHLNCNVGARGAAIDIQDPDVIAGSRAACPYLHVVSFPDFGGKYAEVLRVRIEYTYSAVFHRPHDAGRKVSKARNGLVAGKTLALENVHVLPQDVGDDSDMRLVDFYLLIEFANFVELRGGKPVFGRKTGKRKFDACGANVIVGYGTMSWRHSRGQMVNHVLGCGLANTASHGNKSRFGSGALLQGQAPDRT